MTNKLEIVGGIIGAIAGFVATLLLLELVGFGNRADPIASGLLALLAIAPLGAITGLVLGTKLVMLIRGKESTGSLPGNSLKAFAALIALCAAAGTAYYLYAVNTATPWLNPNAATPLLLFEVRLPAGTALPASGRDVVFELQTDLNTMPGETKPDRFRRDGDRPVVAGEVELAFRTSHRSLLVRIKGQPDRLYPIGLSAKAPHTSALGPWFPQADGSAIRYRAKWAGRE